MESKLLPNGLSDAPKMKCLRWDGLESKLNFLFNVEKLNYNSKLEFIWRAFVVICYVTKKRRKQMDIDFRNHSLFGDHNGVMLGYLPCYNKAVSDIDTNSGAPTHPDS